MIFWHLDVFLSETMEVEINKKHKTFNLQGTYER